MIAADGVLNALDYTRTCTCSYALQTSLAMIHMPDDSNIEFWTRYTGARPDPSGHGINFGAPGRRVDVGGSGLVWYDEEGDDHRHPSAIRDSGGGIDWVLASVREGGGVVEIPELLDRRYTVRLHFAELDERVRPGQRVFDVFIDGRRVLERYDIVEEANGALRGTVEVFVVDVENGVMDIELSMSGDSRLDPAISGIELIAENR